MNGTRIQKQESYFKKIRQMQTGRRFKRNLLEVIVYLFVLLFVYTASSKLLELSSFKKVLLHYPLIGKWNLLFAYLIPTTELAVSLLLIVPFMREIGLRCAFMLMLAFLIYIIYMLASGSVLPCSCGGIISRLSWTQHIWFNSTFLLLSLVGIRLSRYKDLRA